MSHIDPPQPTYVSNFTHMLSFMNQHQAQFQEQVTQILMTLTSPHNSTSESSSSDGGNVKLHNPRVFNCCHEEVILFLSEVQQIIKFHPSSFLDDHQKVLFVTMYLKDSIPIEWFNHLEVSKSPILHHWLSFMSKFQKKFGNPQLSLTADQKLEKLKQTGLAHAYLTCFVKLSLHLKMTEQTKINWFMKGLKPVIKDNLISIIDWPLTLMGWENIIIQVNANLHQHDLEQKEEPKGKTMNHKSSSSDHPLNCPLLQLLCLPSSPLLQTWWYLWT